MSTITLCRNDLGALKAAALFTAKKAYGTGLHCVRIHLTNECLNVRATDRFSAFSYCRSVERDGDAMDLLVKASDIKDLVKMAAPVTISLDGLAIEAKSGNTGLILENMQFGYPTLESLEKIFTDVKNKMNPNMACLNPVYIDRMCKAVKYVQGNKAKINLVTQKNAALYADFSGEGYQCEMVAMPIRS